MTDKLLKLIGDEYPLAPVDPGEFRTMKVSGMHFTVSAYDAEGLGRVSVMDVHGMMGLMQMQTMVINPFFRDAPLLSLDSIHAMGNDTLLLEPFNTRLEAEFDDSAMLAVRERYNSLPEKDPGVHWYDELHLPSAVFKKGRKCRAEMAKLAEEFLAAYLCEVKRMPACDASEKRKKAAAYSEGLLEHGGPATDPFLKQYGKEKTAAFFRDVLFGAGGDR